AGWGGRAAATDRAERHRQRDLPPRRRALRAASPSRRADRAAQRRARLAAEARATAARRRARAGRARAAERELSLVLGDPHLGRGRDRGGLRDTRLPSRVTPPSAAAES